MEKWDLQKREFSLKGGVSEFIEIFLSFGGCLESSNEEKIGRQQKEEVL